MQNVTFGTNVETAAKVKVGVTNNAPQPRIRRSISENNICGGRLRANTPEAIWFLQENRRERERPIFFTLAHESLARCDVRTFRLWGSYRTTARLCGEHRNFERQKTERTTASYQSTRRSRERCTELPTSFTQYSVVVISQIFSIIARPTIYTIYVHYVLFPVVCSQCTSSEEGMAKIMPVSQYRYWAGHPIYGCDVTQKQWVLRYLQ